MDLLRATALSVNMNSSVNSTAPQLVIKAHVVDHICEGHRAQNLDAVYQLDFLRDKTLADPYFGKSCRVHLLIGIKYAKRCRRHMSIEDAPDRDLVAIEAIFGWVIGGDTQIYEDSENKEIVYPCYHADYEDTSTDELLKKFFEQEEVPTQEEPSLASED